MAKNSKYPVVCFGESLWDFLPKGKLPGGAPTNVAYHLQKLGKNPAVISRVGKDELGTELVNVFNAKHIDTSYFQYDEVYATGKVYATVKDNQEVEYEIVQPVAWDFIQCEKKDEEIISNADYFVFGSLASRNKNSRDSLLHCIEFAKTKVLDINLRPPHYHRDILEMLLQRTDILKLNLSELQLVSSWYADLTSNEKMVQLLSEKFAIKTIVVTKGGDGAMLYSNGNFYYHPGYKVKVADTIGSGDSFLAAMISKFMENASPEEALDYASALGAFVASRAGACPDYDVAEVESMMNKKSSE